VRDAKNKSFAFGNPLSLLTISARNTDIDMLLRSYARSL